MVEARMKADFVKNLQNKIMVDMRKIYSPKILSHWQHPQNWGIMNDASGYGKITGPCGDTMEISIKVEDKKIVKCTFDTDGCGSSIACASIITEMVSGMAVAKARRITQSKMLQFCGGLPEEDKHCALLAVNTLQKAIDDYETTLK
ncbi:MAG: iron-sulfur cluster assembly scaffold protein [bacterium]